jgi:hypothetical protein
MVATETKKDFSGKAAWQAKESEHREKALTHKATFGQIDSLWMPSLHSFMM